MRRRSLLASVFACALCWVSAPLFAQARYNVHFRAARISGSAGQVVTMGIGLDNQPDKVTGFSFGVKHDAAKLSIDSVALGADLQAAIGAGRQPDDRFYSVNQAPQGGTGLTIAMILSADQAAVSIPAGLDHHIFDIKYQIPAGATGESKIDITGDLGNPKVGILLDINNGTSQKPAGAAGVVSATVAVSAGPPGFVRGDANQSGRLEITDAIILLDFLFSGSTLPAGAATRTNCQVAMNFDGSVGKATPGVEDAQDIDLTDAVSLLQYVFQRGLAPPAPFPTCGQSTATVAAEITCKEFLCH